MKYKFLLLLIAGWFAVAAQTPADNTPTMLGVSSDYRFSFNYVEQVWRLKDGRVIALGYFPINLPSSSSRNVIMRFNADGSPDGTFKPISGLNGEIREIEMLPDGKMLVCGSFTMLNDVRVYQVVRFFPNGQPDPSFKSVALGNSEIEEMDFLSHGKIRIYGVFSDNATGRVYRRVSVINANGSFLRDERFK